MTPCGHCHFRWRQAGARCDCLAPSCTSQSKVVLKALFYRPLDLIQLTPRLLLSVIRSRSCHRNKLPQGLLKYHHRKNQIYTYFLHGFTLYDILLHRIHHTAWRLSYVQLPTKLVLELAYGNVGTWNSPNKYVYTHREP